MPPTNKLKRAPGKQSVASGENMKVAVAFVIGGMSVRKVATQKEVSKSALQRCVKKVLNSRDEPMSQVKFSPNYLARKVFTCRRRRKIFKGI